MGRLHVHFDAVGGAAGDMIVAALLDARPDLGDRVRADLAAVLPPEAGAAHLLEGFSGGLKVLRFRLDGEPPAVGRHGGPAGSYHDMSERIRRAALAGGTAERALAILDLIARVESELHGVPIDAVHFHEIADWDSLADVVAIGSIAAALGEATYSVSQLPRGGGLVRTQHGLLPVPAPATAALLKGFSWRDDGIPGERVTPTGAAALAHLVGAEVAPSASGRLLACGTGAGTRDLPGLPNILRALVFEREPVPSLQADAVAVLSFDVDDMTGEEIAVAADLLRDAPGVIDLTIGTRAGKKGRLTHDFRLLARPEFAEDVARRCLEETSTLGLRWRIEQRRLLARTEGVVATPCGEVRIKRTLRPDGCHSVKAESDDLSGTGLAARRRLKRLSESDG